MTVINKLLENKQFYKNTGTRLYFRRKCNVGDKVYPTFGNVFCERFKSVVVYLKYTYRHCKSMPDESIHSFDAVSVDNIENYTYSEWSEMALESLNGIVDKYMQTDFNSKVSKLKSNVYLKVNLGSGRVSIVPSYNGRTDVDMHCRYTAGYFRNK